ncbi:MAG: hypothetical protein RLZZ517_203 [Candidatus Parcubacteria bacterium]|jgi:hypothetical protein
MNKGHTEEDKYIANKFNEYKEFIKDKQVSFVIKKTERIVYGVYMLSRFVPTEDVLNQDLKKTSHLLLEAVSQFVTKTAIEEGDINRVHSYLQYLSSLLSLSFISGYISGSNIEIMKNEINYLHKHIEELSTSSASELGQLHIKSDMFVIQHHKQPKVAEEKMSFKQVRPSSIIKKDTPKMSFKSVGANSLRPSKEKGVSQSNDSKDTRETRVLDVIRDKGIVSIKDISTVIFDVSEKTIQRTLQTLIDKGQIKKEGERRWAKYQLI